MPVQELQVIDKRHARIRFDLECGPLTSYWVVLNIHEGYAVVGNPPEAEPHRQTLKPIEIEAALQLLLGYRVLLKPEPMRLDQADPNMFWHAYDFEKINGST